MLKPTKTSRQIEIIPNGQNTNTTDKTPPSPTRRLFPRLSAIQDNTASLHTNNAIRQDEDNNSDDDYNRDLIPTNAKIEDEIQDEQDIVNEINLHALAQSNDRSEDRVCYRLSLICISTRS